jgi:hypothetical protein
MMSTLNKNKNRKRYRTRKRKGYKMIWQSNSKMMIKFQKMTNQMMMKMRMSSQTI